LFESTGPSGRPKEEKEMTYLHDMQPSIFRLELGHRRSNVDLVRFRSSHLAEREARTASDDHALVPADSHLDNDQVKSTTPSAHAPQKDEPREGGDANLSCRRIDILVLAEGFRGHLEDIGMGDADSVREEAGKEDGEQIRPER
jgi:hypothetical protein